MSLFTFAILGQFFQIWICFVIPITNYNFKFPNLQLSFCCEFGKFTRLLVWQFCKIAGSAQNQAKFVR